MGTDFRHRPREQGRKVPSDLPEVLAQKIVQAGQTLLTLVGEIKRNALVSDFAARNAEVATARERFAVKQAAAEDELQGVMTRIAEVTQVCSCQSCHRTQGCVRVQMRQLKLDNIVSCWQRMTVPCAVRRSWRHEEPTSPCSLNHRGV